MNLPARSIGLVALAVLPSAAVHAQVTKVEAVPATTLLNVPVVIKVTGGRAPCTSIAIDFDDGANPQVFDGQQPNFEVSHAWPDDDRDKLPNVKVVRVKGNGCGGQAETTVTVLEEFKLVPRPKIKTYFGLATPGGVAGIVGGSFGATEGKAQARLKDSKGAAKVIDLDIIDDPTRGNQSGSRRSSASSGPRICRGFPSRTGRFG